MTSPQWKSIEEVSEEARICCRCDLCYGRTHVVFGQGPPDAQVMIVGEAPGAEEDRSGRPFVGKAGRRLDRLLREAGLDRDALWITNIVRCRSAVERDAKLWNRAPRGSEVSACDIWTAATYRLIDPALVVCLGVTPARALISRSFRIGEGRGRWYEGREGKLTTATFHPAYIPRGSMRAMEEQIVQGLRMIHAELGKLRGRT